MSAQPAILKSQKAAAKYLTANRRLNCQPAQIGRCLAQLVVDEELIVGIGPGLALLLGIERPELRSFPALSGVGIEVPSTQSDLWIWCNCDDRAAASKAAEDVRNTLGEAFQFNEPVDGFKHGETESGLGRDLTGYEDGTENPGGEDALAAAIAADGSSFVAVQTWKHDLAYFSQFSQKEQDHMIGRRLEDNEELDDAPASAHVKRTAQESFDPEAFVLRRSLPWSGPTGEGLMFVAFGKSLDAFEVQLKRMAGLDDGIIDACFRFSRPITGGYYWCAPVENHRLVLPS